ncbi:MAG: hypothetical protein PHE29_08220 [Tissierellia bacterium]|nr:hypothetical protein [Tissierellia bacterium]MDD4779050.1 hypothetical protein [Tissierellia bacterium]
MGTKYIKFLKTFKDSDLQYIFKEGDMFPVEMGVNKKIGLFYSTVVNEQKYCFPEKYNKNNFEIIEKED